MKGPHPPLSPAESTRGGSSQAAAARGAAISKDASESGPRKAPGSAPASGAAAIPWVPRSEGMGSCALEPECPRPLRASSVGDLGMYLGTPPKKNNFGADLRNMMGYSNRLFDDGRAERTLIEHGAEVGPAQSRNLAQKRPGCAGLDLASGVFQLPVVTAHRGGGGGGGASSRYRRLEKGEGKELINRRGVPAPTEVYIRTIRVGLDFKFGVTSEPEPRQCAITVFQ
ncbi:hypothetical protein EDB86DRAFT_3219281 [Lactarius hatsudake]|nr:hypothetical protein EDB86DRAFT_3219281 [Lactarius hatsudake]